MAPCSPICGTVFDMPAIFSSRQRLRRDCAVSVLHPVGLSTAVTMVAPPASDVWPARNRHYNRAVLAVALLVGLAGPMPGRCEDSEEERSSFILISGLRANDIIAHLPTEFVVGKTYSMPGPRLRKKALFSKPAGNDFGAITCHLAFDGKVPSQLTVSSSTGNMLFLPQPVALPTVALLQGAGGACSLLEQVSDRVPLPSPPSRPPPLS